jgi:tRNA-2-methylthio-N6-dimethylallyladenosine synthase
MLETPLIHGPKTFCVQVFGCQMNKLDGQLVADRLRAMGLREADDEAAADLLLYVTCSVRRHAEQRVYSNVGKLKHRKRSRPELLIGILGCMAEKDREEIFRRLPHVDFICGPGQLDRLEQLIRDAAATRGAHLAALAAPRDEPAVEDTDCKRSVPHDHNTKQAEPREGETDDHLEPFEEARLTPVGEHPFHAYVRVMRGCDNFCSYCVVPFVRGPQASRPPSAVLAEVGRLVASGVRHVTLLGQSIGSYERTEAGRTWRLADLVRAAAATARLLRLDFVTTHPKDLSDAIIDCLAEGGPIAPYLHVPAQSGADRILAAMNRGYTVAEYRRKVARAREKVPGVAIASDFIVGFPGETDDDFRQTLALVREMRYSQVFAFKYSERPGTAAVKLTDDVPEAAKKERLQQLLDAHAATAIETNRSLIGGTLDCLVTGPGRKPHLDNPASSPSAVVGTGLVPVRAVSVVGATPVSPGRVPEQSGAPIQLSSRSPGHQIVLFHGSLDLVGRIIPVHITRASAITLFGELV